MKRFVIACLVCLAATALVQPSFAQCNQDTLRAWLENDLNNLHDTLRAQLQDDINNSRLTLRAQIEDRIHNAELTLRAQLQDDIANSRITLRAQLEAAINDAVQTILDEIHNSGADGLKNEIEEALRVNRRIATYYLPAPAGNLTLARQIVVDTIAAVTASGESANSAAAKLASADTEIAAHRYKRGWIFLSQAYFEAIKIVGEVQ